MRRFDGKQLVIASHNAGKVREIGVVLEPFGVVVRSAGELGLEDPVSQTPGLAGDALPGELAVQGVAGGEGLAVEDGSGWGEEDAGAAGADELAGGEIGGARPVFPTLRQADGDVDGEEVGGAEAGAQLEEVFDDECSLEPAVLEHDDDPAALDDVGAGGHSC